MSQYSTTPADLGLDIPYKKLSWTQRTIISVNVSLKKEISSDLLVKALTEKKYFNDWKAHVCCFFSDLTEDCIVGFLKENNLSPENIADIFYECAFTSSGIFDKLLITNL